MRKTNTANRYKTVPPRAPGTTNINSTGSSSNNKLKLATVGTRIKAQYEINGAQYFLGIFDSEEAAWTAYENISRSSHQIANLLPPLPDSYEDILPLLQPTNDASAPSVTNKASTTAAGAGANTSSSGKSTNSSKQDKEKSTRNPAFEFDNMKQLWQRLCEVYQRQLLAKSVYQKLYDIHTANPSSRTEALITPLREEVVMLTVVKAQLEELIMEYFTSEIESPSMAGMVSSKDSQWLDDAIQRLGLSEGATVDDVNRALRADHRIVTMADLLKKASTPPEEEVIPTPMETTVESGSGASIATEDISGSS